MTAILKAMKVLEIPLDDTSLERIMADFLDYVHRKQFSRNNQK